jgi:hypothetical protein
VDNPALVDAAGRMEIIRELCSFERRLTGTDAERRAAAAMAERLRALDRKVDVEPIYVHPQYALVHALHCALGVAGSLVAIEVPALGFGLVLAAAASMYLDLNARLYLARRLFFRRASQNVVSPGANADAPARLILSAHLDAAHGGAVFSRANARRFARLARSSPLPLGPFRILFWSLAALVPLLGLRMAGVDSDVVSVLQLVPTLILLVGVFALVEIALSDPVPAANDNAYGVATALSLAAELGDEPPENLDVWVVLTGAGESLSEGMREFVRAHRSDLERPTTFFIDLDSVGFGEPRFATGAGWAVSVAMDKRLCELAAAIATADSDGDRAHRAAAYASGLGGEAVPPRLAGFRTLAITCHDPDGVVRNRHLPADVPKTINAAALDRAHGFALELINRLDADVGRGETR